MGPVKQLPDRFRYVNFDDVNKFGGRDPFSRLRLRSMTVSSGYVPITGGRGPSNELFDILKEVSLKNCEVSLGKVPINEFELR